MNHLLAAAVLIVLHNVDGEPIFVNPEFITMLYPTKEGRGTAKNQLMTSGVNCVITLTTGKFFSVIEPCQDVRKMMEIAK